jgi:hypothetical protein
MVRLAVDPQDSIVTPAQALVESNRIALVDAGEADAKVFDAVTGALLQTIGQPGDRPGQFRSPIAITGLGAGGFAILDVGRRIVSIRDSVGNLEREFAVPGFWVSIGAVPAQHRILLSGSPAPMPDAEGLGMEIHEYDYSGNLIRSYRKSAEPRSEWEASLSHVFFAVNGDHVLSGSFSSNQVEVYDRGTGEMRVVEVAPGWYHPIVWPSNNAGLGGGTGVQRVTAWIHTQRLMTGVFPLLGGRFVARFEAYLPSGKKVYYYAVCSGTGQTLAITQATRARVVASRQDTVYWIELSGSRSATLGRGTVRNSVLAP